MEGPSRRHAASRWHQALPLALVVGASVAFGMVLAGGLAWSPAGMAAPEEPAPVSVAPAASAMPMAGFADLAAAAAPAVVSIQTVSFAEATGRRSGREGAPFDFFLPRRPGGEEEGQRDEERELRSEAGGSGFLISPDGLLVTNFHVIAGATEVTVQTDSGTDYRATVRGIDEETDLALLQIETSEPLPFLRIGSSESLRVGDWVMVIGNPLRLGRTVTVGVVSATGRSVGIINASFENFIQTDAAINFGNSGGPMVNLRGEVVGIATAINWGAENIGFAVPTRTLSQVLPQLTSEGRVRRGYLGVNIENLSTRAMQAFGLESTDGVLVEQVVPGTPAADAGLEHEDVILAIDGQPVASTRQLIDTVSQHPPGAVVTLEVLRGGARIERRVTLGERPGQPAEAAPDAEEAPAGAAWLGLSYQGLTPGLKSAHGIPDDVGGVWVGDVAARSPLLPEGVQPGDVVTEVSGQPVPTPEAFEEAVTGAPSGSYLRFYVQRFGPQGRSVRFFAFVEVP